MTAEVGVLNKMGVALAADSAVSIGPDADKIYSSVDKLFNLSNSAPVGIMINGNAEFLGVPWETIIKTYRSDRDGKRFPTLAEYRDDFFRYLSTNRKMFPVALQSDYVESLTYSYLVFVRGNIKSKFDRIAEEKDGLDDKDLPPIINGVIEEEFAAVKKKDRLRGFGGKTIADLRKMHSKQFSAAVKEVFGDLPMTAATKRLVSRLLLDVLSRDHMGPFMTGVIFAGFGDDEFMPRLCSVNVEIMIRNRIRAVDHHDIEISHQTTASIVPFAQQEMVHAFLNGIDPGFNARIRMTTQKMFNGIVDLILSEVENNDAEFGARLRKQVSSPVAKALTAVNQDWDNQSREHWWPIISIASSLPKDELASMAEALVNLTKFRRRISEDRETVGGPIDVAVITRGDGFVWVKRKHYFSPELNPRIIARYASRR